MGGLVEDLKAEHREVLEGFVRAKDLCIRSGEGFDELKAAIEKLLKHLRHEDDSIYPGLREAARANPALMSLLNTIEREMKEVTLRVEEFSAKYERGCKSMDFVLDFGVIFIILKDRIAKEEKVLFPEYLRLCPGTS